MAAPRQIILPCSSRPRYIKWEVGKLRRKCDRLFFSLICVSLLFYSPSSSRSFSRAPTRRWPAELASIDLLAPLFFFLRQRDITSVTYDTMSDIMQKERFKNISERSIVCIRQLNARQDNDRRGHPRGYLCLTPPSSFMFSISRTTDAIYRDNSDDLPRNFPDRSFIEFSKADNSIIIRYDVLCLYDRFPSNDSTNYTNTHS